MLNRKPLVAVIMGSKSDWDTMRNAVETLDELGVPNEARVLSAHRTPDATAEFARGAADRGLRVIIAGAGGAAHLAGVIAAHTWLPVLGVPIQSKLQGSIRCCPQRKCRRHSCRNAGHREAGAKNAGLLAAAILATSDDTLREKLEAFRKKQSRKSGLWSVREIAKRENSDFQPTAVAAVELLRKGDLVALPTETVYGLAANALNPIAVAKIFEAKERTALRSAIVHLPNREWLKKLPSFRRANGN
jgi:5-(carboxyamino)imidazole ribonucleotide mutase